MASGSKETRSSLREVAARTGVSSATVSRVLNNPDFKVLPETRERIERVASELGYRANRAARSLATGRTQAVALCVPTLHSAHTARIISAAVAEIHSHGYDVLIAEMHLDAHSEIDTEKLHSLPVDAIMFSEMPHGLLPGLENSHLCGKPFVNFGAYVSPEADHVCVDLQTCSEEAIRHLYASGCRRIAYMVWDMLDWFGKTSDARLLAYETVMQELGMETEFVLTYSPDRRTAGPALASHIERFGCPDGLFCFNDEIAIGALRALCDLGIRVPHDVAVAGCDGIEDTAYHNPSLTTVSWPTSEVCRKSWEILERRIQDPTLPLQQTTIEARLEIRESTRRK